MRTASRSTSRLPTSTSAGTTSFSTIAFLVANLWNFQLNRLWTFRSAAHASWIKEYLPFLAVGLLGQIVGLGILTLLMHPGS